MMTPRQQLEAMIDRYDAGVAAVTRGALARLRRQLPGAVEMVYDNRYALVVGFGPREKPSEAWVSVAMYAKKVVLVFIQGARLEDPEGRLGGGGKQVRHVRLESGADVDEAWVKDMVKKAVEHGGVETEGKKGRVVIRAVAEKRAVQGARARSGRPRK